MAGVFSWVDDLVGDVDERREPFDGIDWVYQVSSNVQAIRHDPAYDKLQIAFLNGSVYEYDNFTTSDYQDFLGYPSKGKFVWAAVRGPFDSNYKYRRIK